MHPTIDEQLEGIARLIDRSVETTGDGPECERLRTAAGTLRRISKSWTLMLPYLTWDNEATVRLLESLEIDLSQDLLDQVRTIGSTPMDPLDFVAVHDRNNALRGVLSDAIQSLPASADTARAAITSHIRERIARDPSSGRSRR
jgi:hypothetical protein